MNKASSLSSSQQIIGLVIAITLCFAAAGLGGLVTSPQIPGWYATLAKPIWNPPAWIFGPVWSLLYLMMAVAAWLVWRQAGIAGAKLPLGLFAVREWPLVLEHSRQRVRLARFSWRLELITRPVA